MPYVGELAEIPAGQGTLTSDNNPARARFLDLIVAEGITSEKGVWEREPGATPYALQTLGSGLASFSFNGARGSGAATVFASYKLTGAFQYIGQNTNTAGVTSGPTQITVGQYADAGAANIPSGAAIAIAVSRFHPTGAFSAVTDDAGNTYTMAGRQVFAGGTAVVELWVALNVNALAAGQHITVTVIAGGSAPVYVASVHVLAGLRAADQANTVSVAAGALSMTQSPAFAPAEQNEAILTAYADLDNGNGVTGNPASMSPHSKIALGISSIFFTSPFPFSTVAANALADYWIDSATQRLLAAGSDGILYKSTGAAFAALTMATVLADDATLIVVGGQEKAGNPRKAFVFDGGHNRIQTLSGDGAATTDFGNGWNTTTNIPVDWTTNPPRGGVIHKGRLWCWAPANAPHNIYASQIGDHENFKNAVGGSFEYVQALSEGVGLRIAACVSFKGMLFAFKYPRGILFLDDTDVDYLNWRWNPVTDAVGVADSPYSVIVLDDDVLFFGADGHLNFLSATTQQGVTPQDLTAALNLQQYTRDNINLNRLSRMASCWYPAKKQAFIGLSSLTKTSNDLRLLLDFSNAEQEGQTVRIHHSHRDVNRCLAVRRESTTAGVQRPIFGDDTGLVWKMDQASKTVVGRPNVGQARYQYNRTDFSHIDPAHKNRRKIFDALTVNFKPTGNWNLSIDTVIDGRYHETLHFSMGGSASTLGTFTFGSRLGGGTITTTRRRMTGHGYWLSLAGWVSGEGRDFAVTSHLVNFRPGGEEQRK